MPTGFDSPELLEQIDIKKFIIMHQQKQAKAGIETQDDDIPTYSEILQKPAAKAVAVEGQKKEVECTEWKK